MTVVYFTDGSKESYHSATIKTSGWVFCYDEHTKERDVYPPHQIERIWDDGEGRKGEKLTHSSPHGRV